MSIWVTPLTLDELNERERLTAAGRCGIRFTAIGADWLEATAPLDPRTAAPDGSLHVGALAILAETVGSIATNLCLDPSVHSAVGQVLDVTHPWPVIAGPVRARAHPLALDASSHVWSIDMRDSTDSWVSNARLTMALIRARPRLRLDGGR